MSEQNLDNIFLKNREKKFNKSRTTNTQIQKHYFGMCNCKKKNKFCIYDLIQNKSSLSIDLTKFNDTQYITENMKILEAIYNINQSITQSLRSTTGKDFEKCLEDLFSKQSWKKGIDYESQVYITDDNEIHKKKPRNKKCHSMDFIIPLPKLPCNLDTYKGYLVSCKSTIRERYLQDVNYKRIIFISLDKINNEKVKSIQIKKDGNELSVWFQKLKKKFNKLKTKE